MTFLIVALLWLAAPGRPEPADAPAPLNGAIPQDIDSPMKLVASMTKYSVGVLWKGPKWTEESAAQIDERIRASAHSWRSAVAEGKLVGAVRVAEPVDLWGLLFFKTESMEEMEAITDQALSVKEGLLDGEVLTVWGTRGLGTGLAEALQDDPDTELEREEYYMAIYRKGPNWSEDAYAPETREATSETIQYLFDLYQAGKLKYSASLEDYSRNARGMAILSTETAEEALDLADDDPMVKKGMLTVSVSRVYIVGGVLP